MPTIEVPQPIWELAQRISGCKNPGNFFRNDVLWLWYAHQAQAQSLTNQSQPPTNLDNPPPSAVDFLRARKERLGCLDHSLDKPFKMAWAWVCDEMGSELAAVEYLEEQVALPPGAAMTNPRAVVMTRWREYRRELHAAQPTAS